MKWLHMSGAGNRFLVGRMDDQAQPSFTSDEVLKIIGNNPRADGESIEGVLVLRGLDARSFNAEYYNPDGSHGMMCGNGARCIVRFAIDQGVTPDHTIPFTLNNVDYTAQLYADDTISIDFAPPVQERELPQGALDGVDVEAYYVDIKSDHVVIGGPLDPTRPVVQRLRYHNAFPNGVNVNMAEVHDRGTIRLATYERGVEAVTGACGTGAVSTVISLWRKGEVGDSVTVTPPSGRPLTVTIHHDGDQITKTTLRGDARYDEHI